MPAQLLPVAATAANSSDIVVTTTPVTVSLKGAEVGALVVIQLKDDAGAYADAIGGILNIARPAVVISAPGTYRLRRAAGAACGAFSG